MVRFIKEIILKYLLGISKCTKLPGNKTKKEQKKNNKETKTISQNNYKFTYRTYLHLGNNPGHGVFSKICFFFFLNFIYY